MGDRALAHVEKIVKVYPIEGADNIEMVQLLDFHVVVKKNEFKVGDLALYVEVDSILPDGLPTDFQAPLSQAKKSLKVLVKEEKKATGEALVKVKEEISKINEEISKILSNNVFEEFEFLRAKEFTIKSLKYSKFLDQFGNPIVSMGIVFPIDILKTVSKKNGKEVSEIVLGMDVTENLGIQKVIEDPEEAIKNVSEKNEKGAIEAFFDKRFYRYKFYRKLKNKIVGEKISGTWLDIFPPRSDEENVQKIFSRIVNTHGREGYYISEKIEGNSTSFYTIQQKTFFGLFSKWKFGVCSRNRNLITDDGSDFWKCAKYIDVENKLRKLKKNIFIRGEKAHKGLQGNIYNFTDMKFFVYDVYDMDEQRLYNFDEMIQFCKDNGFEHVPILDENFILPETVQELLAMSNGYSVFGDKVLREGLVIRKKNDSKISFKVKSPEYLILHGK